MEIRESWVVDTYYTPSTAKCYFIYSSYSTDDDFEVWADDL